MIYVPADPDIGFKNCCLRKGKFDGSLRDYYFQGVNNPRARSYQGARPFPLRIWPMRIITGAVAISYTYSPADLSEPPGD
jgi:hypothetical protein